MKNPAWHPEPDLAQTLDQLWRCERVARSRQTLVNERVVATLPGYQLANGKPLGDKMQMVDWGPWLTTALAHNGPNDPCW
jgi:hypothetical protein